MNQQLDAPFTEQEVSDALFQMNALGALGLDGFPAHFYQKFWHSIRMDMLLYSYYSE